MKKQKIALSKLTLKKDVVTPLGAKASDAVKGGDTLLTFCAAPYDCTALPATAGSQCCGPAPADTQRDNICNTQAEACHSTYRPTWCGAACGFE